MADPRPPRATEIVPARSAGCRLARAVARWALGLLLVGCGGDGSPSNAGSAGAGAVSNGGTAGAGSGGTATQAGTGGGAGNITQGGDGPLGGGGSGMSGAAGGPARPTFPPLIEGCDIPVAHARADAALASMLLHFWSGSDQYLYATSNPGGLTGYWTYAQGFDALLDGVERTGGQRYRGLMRSFYQGRDERGWLVDYYDDESWMTLALIRAYDLTGEQLYLDRAKTLYADVMAAWDTTCCGDHLGGIWWNRQHEQKATASNAGPVIAGVRLTARTDDAQYLEFAKQAYAFWWQHMVDQPAFAIYDHLNPDGTRAPGSLTYNHGLMIGAALELHAATGEAHFLEEAHGFGEYLITVATRDSDVGPLLHDAIGQDCDGDCPAWKGIGYRYLAELYAKDPTRAEYREVLTAGAEGIWTLARSADRSFFSTNWAGPPPSVGGIEEQGSAVMALNLYAMLCGSDSQPVATAGRYEAEEAWVDHVALEAQYGGFSGFGYVASFSEEDQAVTFYVDSAAAGTYRVDWTYSAGAGSASRSVSINDVNVQAAQAFPATGAWDAWRVASTSLNLPAGKSTLSLSYAVGNSGGLNLDRIDLVAE